MKAMNAKTSKARLPTTPPAIEGTLLVDDTTWGLGVGERTGVEEGTDIDFADSVTVTVDVVVVTVDVVVMDAVTSGVTAIKSRKIVVLSECMMITNV